MEQRTAYLSKGFRIYNCPNLCFDCFRTNILKTSNCLYLVYERVGYGFKTQTKFYPRVEYQTLPLLLTVLILTPFNPAFWPLTTLIISIADGGNIFSLSQNSCLFLQTI